MTKILKADGFYNEVLRKLRNKIASENLQAAMEIIRFGEKEQDLAYERGIKKSAEKLGIKVKVNELNLDAKEDEVINLIDKINKDNDIGGLLIFRPLPENLNEEKINSAISPLKDIDCMHELNRARIYSGDLSGFIPLAAKAAVDLIKYYEFDLEGKNCLIINHSNVVGKPLAMILLENWATVTVAHVKTKNLKELTKRADYIFTAMGKAEMLDSSYFSKDSIVIDIGLSRNKEGNMRGDLNANSVEGKIYAYSPVPGGVGKLTNLLLLENVLKYYDKGKKTKT